MTPKQRIKNFNSVRDIPYRIPLTKSEIIKKDHSCVGKSKMLFDLFKSAYPVRYRACNFFWQDLGFPKDILKKLKTKEVSRHYYIEIFLNRDWITLDSSLDKNLSKLISINNWDGFNSTDISLKYVKILSPKQSRQKTEEDFNPETRIRDIKLNYTFFKEVNMLYEKIRQL